MKTISEYAVTLSKELFDQLHHIAANLEVPLEWLVAGLVCDTIEEEFAPVGSRHPDIVRDSLV